MLIFIYVLYEISWEDSIPIIATIMNYNENIIHGSLCFVIKIFIVFIKQCLIPFIYSFFNSEYYLIFL